MSKQNLSEELEAHQLELENERRRLQEKDSQLQSVQECLQKQLRGSEQESAKASRSLEELRSELDARREAQADALARQRERLVEEHQQELQSMLKAREAEHQKRLEDQAEQLRKEAANRREAEEAAKAEVAAHLSNAKASASQEVLRQKAEVEAARVELKALHSQVEPLQVEHSQATTMLHEARKALRTEQEDRMSGAQVAALEQRLAEAHSEHQRAEQRHGDVTLHLKAQLRDLQDELKTQTDELQQRDAVVQQRNQELADVNGQLKDLQGLFDEVNHQLQHECGRIERLQGSVTQCAKQAKELESLQNMLEESHVMLAQLRETLEKEKAERLRVAGLLEHEQQRTQLLLDVLKHFKEKLQGLTPQVLLGRLGDKALFGRGFDEKSLGNYGLGLGTPSHQGSHPGSHQGSQGLAAPSPQTGPALAAPDWLTPMTPLTPSPMPSKPCAGPAGWLRPGFEVPPVPTVPATPMVTPAAPTAM